MVTKGFSGGAANKACDRVGKGIGVGNGELELEDVVIFGSG